MRLLEDREMTLKDFIPIISQPPSAADGLLAVRTAVGARQGRMKFDDDFSLVETVFA